MFAATPRGVNSTFLPSIKSRQLFNHGLTVHGPAAATFAARPCESPQAQTFRRILKSALRFDRPCPSGLLPRAPGNPLQAPSPWCEAPQVYATSAKNTKKARTLVRALKEVVSRLTRCTCCCWSCHRGRSSWCGRTRRAVCPRVRTCAPQNNRVAPATNSRAARRCDTGRKTPARC